MASNRPGTPKGRAPQRGEGPSLVSDYAQNRGKKPRTDTPVADIVERRHPNWVEHQYQFRWLLDSYEGGKKYVNATYGPDRTGMNVRNMVPHKREMPDPQEFPNFYLGTAGYSSGSSAIGNNAGAGP